MAYTFKYGEKPLDGITIQRAVGRGGFGEVYYALTDSGKQVAVKYLRENPEIELRGIAHVMNLKSPHLITIYDVRKNAGGEPFVIMEYISGPSLRELLMAEPRGLGVAKAAFFLNGIAKGLSYLHERGIVHRDLKPANIFYDDGYVKIGDYGLSKHISVSKHSGQTVSVGTVHYMAPEIGSGSYTKAIDVYALGVILYEMLTGRLPFTGSSMGEILMRHLSDRPDLSGIPEPFAGVIAKALAKDPGARYQDVNEMLAVVAESGVIADSMASFDPASLSQIPRHVEASDSDATQTSPPRLPPIPILDIRGAGPAGGYDDALEARVSQRADRLTRKLEAKAAKLERKYGSRGRRTARPAPVSGAHVHPITGRSRAAQIFILLAVTVAASMILGFVARAGNPEEAVAAIGLMLVGGTVATLLTQMVCLARMVTRHPLLDRIAFVALGALFMAPGIALASEVSADRPDFELVVFGPLAALFVCDWFERIEVGRRGLLRGGDVVWPAIVGLIGAAIATDGRFPLVGAGMAATLALLTQAAAAMWPIRTGVAATSGEEKGPKQRGFAGLAWGRARARQGDGAGETDAAAAGDPPPSAPPPAPPPAPTSIGGIAAPVGQASKSAAESAESASAAVSSASTGSSRRTMIEFTEPSLLMRTFNLGLGTIGALMLIAGFAVAVGFDSLRRAADVAVQTTEIHGPRAIVQRTELPIPRAVVLVPILLGSGLLILARRSYGAAHFARGFIGCGLGVAAALAAIGPAAGSIQTFVTSSDWGGLEERDAVRIVVVGVLLALSLALLLWPRRRAARTVVI